MTKVCVVGLGYIGLPTAAMMASRGFEVIGYDVNETAVSSINAGKAHFHEPDLQMLLSAAINTGRLKAQTQPEEADYFIIAVPTPFKDGKKPDMSHVESACDAIAPFLQAGSTVILESTSPVGSTEMITSRLSAARPDLAWPQYKDPGDAQIAVAHCPERILPGNMLRELVANDRIIGGMTDTCSRRAQSLYETFVTGQIYITDCRTAEFVKLIENASRDVNIAFANELSVICDRIGVDVWQAVELANKHPRVSILQPGTGVGGHCIAVDPWFIVDSAPEEARLIRTAREVNDRKPEYIFHRILDLADRFKNPVISCFGITYKADVGDLRESPALKIVTKLLQHGGMRVLICDPLVKSLPALFSGCPDVDLVDADAARREADIVALLVGHKQFKRLEFNRFLHKVVIDATGLMSRPNGFATEGHVGPRAERW
ncbi:UDP-N-acetyl-D-mannosamine dehydrogenase [Microvirga puerhi]|uniref:UDP-N-acetyl-D-mannosamine dehydrogenase n=1 Tax=Microvirga puerhi TaxID=2876078 RepID=A0ABS7VV01_9HYPH|nr:UDP-N-acetyl-D-mannosamine dehydrogenase [Microvirga puerhi]MBZ6079394.1 UDP-N-acetyl-D-mannosamine dehydrogenase [Microvirga puerhi]